MTAKISSKYLMGRIGSGVLRLMIVPVIRNSRRTAMIAAMVSACKMVVMASAFRMTPVAPAIPAAGENASGRGEQGDDS